jgi:D-beta-D-heptose 7-phosphate kinase/D-beta-D-heptose 1-phosphate adenosyltransferase
MQTHSDLEIVTAFAEQTVLIVGDVMLDEYIWGDVQRISPEAPVPVVQTHERTYRPGGSGNVAANVSALSALPLLCGVVGDDEMAARLGQSLAANQVAADGLIRVPGRPTTVKSRVIAHSQQMLRLDTETDRPLPVQVEQAILDWCAQAIGRASVCVLSDYAKGTLTPYVCGELIALARERGTPVVVDPKGRDYRKYSGATIVTPNTGELALAVNQICDSRFDLDSAALLLLDQCATAGLLVTRGSAGMSLYRQGQQRLDIVANNRNVYDVTGAGDTVVAALALALAAAAAIDRAAAIANTAASIVVGKVGTATASRDELLDALGHAAIQ